MLPSSIDAHAHEDCEEDEEMKPKTLRLQHRRSVSEEAIKTRRKHHRKRKHVASENETDETKQSRKQAAKQAFQKGIQAIEGFLSRLIMHWRMSVFDLRS